jgi:hypothetical protein
MLSQAVLAVAVSTVMVPPGGTVVDHSQPAHYAQPTLRRFEQKSVDDYRRMQWEAYTESLDSLWREYRASKSTPEAFEFYKKAASERKDQYVFDDPFLAPVMPGPTGLILPPPGVAW